MIIDKTFIERMKKIIQTREMGDVQLFNIIKSFYINRGDIGEKLKSLTEITFELITNKLRNRFIEKSKKRASELEGKLLKLARYKRAIERSIRNTYRIYYIECGYRDKELEEKISFAVKNFPSSLTSVQGYNLKNNINVNLEQERKYASSI